MRFFPGRRVDLDDGTSVEVVTYQELLVPGFVAWEARAGDGQWLAVSEEENWKPDVRAASPATLASIGTRRGARLGAERVARIRTAIDPVAGYRDSAVVGGAAEDPVAFFTLEPTLPFSQLFWRRRAPWPEEVVARLGIELAGAMSAATYAELDPNSVGLSENGAWLLDPGLSLLLRSPSRPPGVLKGHIHWLSYRAPETFQSVAVPTDGRGALHGLGVLLHELLTGAPMSGSEKPTEILEARQTGRPAPLTIVPEALATCVHALLHPDPATRPDPSQVIHALTPHAAPDLTWARPLYEAHATPLSYLHIALRRRGAAPRQT